MLTIGLLQSASMSSRWPPSVSPEKKEEDIRTWLFTAERSRKDTALIIQVKIVKYL